MTATDGERVLSIRTEGYEVATIRAELCGRRNRAAAVATDSRQRSSALLAKLRLGGIVMMALRAFHPAGPEGEAGQILRRLNRACILALLWQIYSCRGYYGLLPRL